MANQRYTFTIDSFKGVDLSSPLTKVDDARATEILNFIKKDGVTQKRKGWHQVMSIVNNKITSNVNGMWSFIDKNNNERVVAHLGTKLYEINGLGVGCIPDDCTYTEIKSDWNLLDTKTQGFISDNMLYILGQNYFFYVTADKEGELSMNRVMDKAYVPTTSISITPTDSPTPSRKVLDDVNMLTPIRKNKLVGGTITDDVIRTTRFYEYILDTNINFKGGKSSKDIEINIKYVRKAEE